MDMFDSHDRGILRDLAKRLAEIAAMPVMAERKELWKKHNSLKPVRPMILIFPEGSWRELVTEESLLCGSPDARSLERQFRQDIYTFEHFHCDNVVENVFRVPKVIHDSGWGFETKRRPSSEEHGAYGFEPVIKEAADLKKLKFPTVTCDEKATQEKYALHHDLFGDIMDVKLTGITHISFHLMQLYTGWRGLEEVMIDMYAEPNMLHDAMALMEEGFHRQVRQYVDQNLLSLNNDGMYHSSGGLGYTDELPKPDYDAEHIRPCDMWASAESQEMAQVSPEMHSEFVMQYEKRLLEHFGLNGYGCCEDLTRKLDDVFSIPNIRRISISPFADVDVCAERLQNAYIFSWKPNPAHLVGHFDSGLIRNYIKHTLDVAKDCCLEIILKDTHTCEHHPERFDEWTRIAWSLLDGVGE